MLLVGTGSQWQMASVPLSRDARGVVFSGTRGVFPGIIAIDDLSLYANCDNQGK